MKRGITGAFICTMGYHGKPSQTSDSSFTLTPARWAVLLFLSGVPAILATLCWTLLMLHGADSFHSALVEAWSHGKGNILSAIVIAPSFVIYCLAGLRILPGMKLRGTRTRDDDVTGRNNAFRSCYFSKPSVVVGSYYGIIYCASFLAYMVLNKLLSHSPLVSSHADSLAVAGLFGMYLLYLCFMYGLTMRELRKGDCLFHSRN